MKKTFKRMVTCIFSALLTVNSVMPAYANEQPISEPLSSTLNVSVIGSGQVKVTENGNETVVTTETPFSQSYAEGTNVKIEAIATEGNVIENFTNNDVAVPEFVAEQNNLKIEYVTGVENSNFVVTFKEIVSSEEQETNEKVDTEPIEQPEAEGETTKEDSIETEEKDKTKDKVDKNSKLLINDETFIPNRPVSAEEQQILNDYQNGMTMKEEYIQKRKEIVDKIHAWKYVDDNYFITAKFYEDYDTANLLLGLGASILIAPDFRYSESASSTYSSDRSLSSPVVTYFEEGGHTSISNGIGSVWGIGGFWKVDGHVAFCGEAMYATPRAGMTLNSAVEVHDDRVRKVIYYAYGYPNNQVSNTFPNRDQALLAMNEFLSAVASGTSISGSTNGQRYHVAYELLKGILNLPSPPSDFKVYKAKCPGTGVSWQGIVTQNQTLYWGQNEPKGNLTIEKSSANPSITDNNNCYSLEGAEYGLYNSEADANKDVNRVGTFTIKADGKANTIKDLKAKTYYLKETKAGKGYALDKKVYSVSVTSGKTEVYKVKDIPQSDPVVIMLRKRDKETGENVPQRDAKLENAEFTVKYYKGEYAEGIDPATQGATPERTWVLKTDEDGFTALDKSLLVSGDEFYYASNGDPTIPVGTVTMQETKAPEGYLLNNEIFVVKVKPEGNDEILNTYQEPIVPEQVIKGKIRIAKKDKDTGKVIQVAGTVFDIYFNGQKVSSMTTDETGYATSEDLAYGEYVIKEAKAPNGYVVDVNQEAVVDIKAEETYDTELSDKRVNATINLVKEDKDTGDRPQGEATLEGAVYGLYAKEDILDPSMDGTVIHKKDSLVGKITTDKNASGTIENLYLGEYYWQEISPSEGYELDETKYPFTASYKDQNTITITVDKTVKETIRTGEFDLIKVITDGSQSEIMVNEKGAEFVAVLKSDYEANGNDIQKALEYAKENRSEKEYAVLTTNKNGYATSGKLAYGKYVIQQTKKGENAEETDILDGIFTFEVTELDGQTIVKGGDTSGNSLEMGDDGKMHYHINNRPSDYFLKLVKIDAESGKQITLSDATFKVKDLSTGKYVRQKVAGVWIDEFNTDKDGYVILPLKLKSGKYQLEEIKAPYNYLLNGTSIPFEIKKSEVTSEDEDGDAYIVVTMEDTRVKGSISFEKRGEVLVGSHEDENGNIVFDYEEQGLEGMTVTVYAKEDIIDPADGTVIYKAGEVVTTATTDKSGKTQVDNLYLGSYIVRETQAPEGFVISDKEYEVTLSYKDDHTAIISDSVTYLNDRQKVHIDLRKVDEDNEANLQGAVFGLYASEDIYGVEKLSKTNSKPLIIKKGTLIETATSDENGQVVFNADLPLSKYEIRELKAPIGYASSDEVIPVDATYKGQELPTIEIVAVFKNKITQVEFSKVDASTNEELEGATQIVYPKGNRGEVFETWVSTKEPHIIKGLEVGQTYIWEEISAPYGFALAEKIEFTVKDTGEVQVAGTMKDEIVYGQLAFEKKGKQFTYTDIGMTDLGMVNTPVFEEMNILGAEITIYAGEDITLGNGITYYKADEEIDTLVSDYEAVQSIKLPVGKYYYVETKAPIGFVKNEEKHYFEVVDNQINELQVIESTLKNERPVYNINMTKQMEFSDTAMNKEAYKDVVFGIYTRDDTYDWKGNVAIEPDTLLATSGIDEEGHLVHTPELPVGNYYLKELQTNSAYKLDENEYDFSIDQSNEKAVIVPINEGKPIINKLKEYYVLVNKVDENTMKNIISKEFEFTSFTDAECKNPIETKQANTKDGTVKFVLNYGTTYIKETKAPLGYSLSPEVVKVEVNDDGLFVNGKKVERSEDLLYSIIYKDSLLPVIQTGAGSDSMLFIVAGLGVLVSLIGILEYRRRNKNKKSENKSE
ncbi:MAG: SpaA isopeptide-forming pilin-related protein [Clostridium sp.]